MNNIEKIVNLLKKIDKLRKKEGLGNIFYNEQYTELLIANKLGHSWRDGQGADAKDGNLNVEYKTFNSENGKGTWQFHWITTDNVHKYNNYEDIYFVWRDNIELKEIYKLKMIDIIPHLILKAKSNGKKGHWGLSKKNLLKNFNPIKIEL